MRLRRYLRRRTTRSHRRSTQRLRVGRRVVRRRVDNAGRAGPRPHGVARAGARRSSENPEGSAAAARLPRRRPVLRSAARSRGAGRSPGRDARRRQLRRGGRDSRRAAARPGRGNAGRDPPAGRCDRVLGPGAAPADGDVAEALVTLAQALNAPTRCALVVLRGGGNRSGAEAVLTWQTGFPFAVDFAPGYPSYRPRPGARGLLAVGELDAALVIGSPASLPEPMATGLAPLVTVAIGPRVSAASFQPAVAVDTGVAGIHEGGTAFRMDDVPLPLRPVLTGPPTTAGALRSLRKRLGA